MISEIQLNYLISRLISIHLFSFSISEHTYTEYHYATSMDGRKSACCCIMHDMQTYMWLCAPFTRLALLMVQGKCSHSMSSICIKTLSTRFGTIVRYSTDICTFNWCRRSMGCCQTEWQLFTASRFCQFKIG